MKRILHNIPGVGPKLAGADSDRPDFAPERGLNYTDEELKQVKILSALDMLSPVYDQPQTMQDVSHWFDDAGMANVQVRHGYNGINAKGRRPN